MKLSSGTGYACQKMAHGCKENDMEHKSKGTRKGEKIQATTDEFNELIDEMRDEEGKVPKQVHDWLSRIGAKGRATPPKHPRYPESESRV
jgi:hypothetical protein